MTEAPETPPLEPVPDPDPEPTEPDPNPEKVVQRPDDPEPVD